MPLAEPYLNPLSNNLQLTAVCWNKMHGDCPETLSCRLL